MKKIAFLIITLALANGLYSQNMNFGIKTGLSMAVQSEIANYTDNDDIRFGLIAGGFVNYKLPRNFGIQLEANYEQKGFSNSDLVSKFDYLVVPILFNYSLVNSDLTGVDYTFSGGGFSGFILKAENEIKTGDAKGKVDVKDKTSNPDFGICLDFGAKYPVANSAIMLDLRLNLGLNKISDVDDKPRNKSITITLGYEF